MRTVSHFTFFILLYVLQSASWNQIRGDYSFPSGSLLGSHSLLSGSTFGTSTSPEFVSWPRTWTTFSLLGPADVSFSFVVDGTLGYFQRFWLQEQHTSWQLISMVRGLGDGWR